MAEWTCCRYQRAIKAVGLVVDLGPVARDRDEIAPLLAEVDGALDDPQLLPFGSLGVALPRAARHRRRWILG